MPRQRIMGIIAILLLLVVAVVIIVVADHREPVLLGPDPDEPAYSETP